MLKIKSYERVNSIAEAYELNQKKSACVLDGIVGGVSARPPDAAPNAHGMLLVRLDDAHGLAEPRLQDVGAGDVLRVLAARVRLEHGGQQALERAVVAVGDLGQGFFGEEGRVLGGRKGHDAETLRAVAHELFD